MIVSTEDTRSVGRHTSLSVSGHQFLEGNLNGHSGGVGVVTVGDPPRTGVVDSDRVG